MIQYEKLNNKLITSVEEMAEQFQVNPTVRGYKSKINRIRKVANVNFETVEAIINHNIGEEWKPCPRFSNYKISNYGRVLGLNGTFVSSYVNKAGVERIDPYLPNRKRCHMSIKVAVSTAFLKPKAGQKVKYNTDAHINTVHHLVIK
jgi:hypothetical protein